MIQRFLLGFFVLLLLPFVLVAQSTLFIIDGNPYGVNTLKSALDDANDPLNPGTDTIRVGTNLTDIYIDSILPAITQPVYIDLRNSAGQRVKVHFRANQSSAPLWFQNVPFTLKNAILLDSATLPAIVDFSRTVGGNINGILIDSVHFEKIGGGEGGNTGILCDDRESGSISNITISNSSFNVLDYGINLSSKETNSNAAQLVNVEIWGCKFGYDYINRNISDAVRNPIQIANADGLKIGRADRALNVICGAKDSPWALVRVISSQNVNIQHNKLGIGSDDKGYLPKPALVGIILDGVEGFRIGSSSAGDKNELMATNLGILYGCKYGQISNNWIGTYYGNTSSDTSKGKYFIISDNQAGFNLSLCGGVLPQFYLTTLNSTMASHNIRFGGAGTNQNLFTRGTGVLTLSGKQIWFSPNNIWDNNKQIAPFRIQSSTLLCTTASNGGNYARSKPSIDSVKVFSATQLRVKVSAARPGDRLHFYLVRDSADHLDEFIDSLPAISTGQYTYLVRFPAGLSLGQFRRLAVTGTDTSGTSEITYHNINLQNPAGPKDTIRITNVIQRNTYCYNANNGALQFQLVGFGCNLDSSYFVRVGSSVRKRFTLISVDTSTGTHTYSISGLGSGTYVSYLYGGAGVVIPSVSFFITEPAVTATILGITGQTCQTTGTYSGQIKYNMAYSLGALGDTINANKHMLQLWSGSTLLSEQMLNNGNNITTNFSIPAQYQNDQLTVKFIGLGFVPNPDPEAPICVNCNFPLCQTQTNINLPAYSLGLFIQSPITYDGARAVYYSCPDDSTAIQTRLLGDITAPGGISILPKSVNNVRILVWRKAPGATSYSVYKRLGQSTTAFTLAGAQHVLPSLNLPLGDYRLRAYPDSANFKCYAADSFSVRRRGPPLSGNVYTMPSKCAEGRASGSAVLFLDGGSNPTVIWERKVGNTYTRIDTTNQSTNIQNLATGQYRVRATEAYGCYLSFLFAIDSVKAPNKPTIINKDSARCKLYGKFTRDSSTSTSYNFIWATKKDTNIVYRSQVNANINSLFVTDTLPTKYLPNADTIYLWIQNDLGCLSLVAKYYYIKPWPDRQFNICIRWGKPTDPVVPPATPTVINATLGGQFLASANAASAACIALGAATVQNSTLGCYDPATYRDSLTIRYPTEPQQTTLYYYNRGGQLVATVPPEGVQRLTTRPTNRSQEADYQLATQYEYTTTGQLIAQTSPDAGKQVLYYNRGGQLRLTQNADQKTRREFSYIKYDAIGQTVEKGVARDSSNTLRDSLEKYYRVLEVGYDNWFDQDSAFGLSVDQKFPQFGGVSPRFRRLEYVRTFYHEADSTIRFRGQYQQNLLGKPSYTTSQGRESKHQTKSFFSYDPHGNVEWICVDLVGLGRKYVAYTYDLISAKVLTMSYNPGYTDQYFVRYGYDQDNRIIKVETSPDSLIWDTDATYKYYMHGPLARVELGHDKVQGLDYTYTINGWLKGINSIRASSDDDLGRDGKRENDSHMTKDEFGMALHYFRGDYVAQNEIGLLKPEEQSQQFRSLYNGNIAAWTQTQHSGQASVVTAKPNFETYRYDKLNRIKSSQSQYVDVSAYEGGASMLNGHSKQFETQYRYDANGNLMSLVRRDSGGVVVDTLLYQYYNLTNRLHRVIDYAGQTDRLDDPEDTLTYTYNAIGQLVQDLKAGINLTWNDNGKLVQVEDVVPNRKPTLQYRYDGAGNRVAEVVRSCQSPHYDSLVTYQVRDLSGNSLAVYKRELGVYNISGGPSSDAAPPGGSGSLPMVIATQIETSIYGSDRIGTRKPNVVGSRVCSSVGIDSDTTAPLFNVVTNTDPIRIATARTGQKVYELKDHLGNVRTTISDERQYEPTVDEIRSIEKYGKIPMLEGAYGAYVQNQMDYYPFGMMKQPEVKDSAVVCDGYRPFNPGACGLAQRHDWNPGDNCCMNMEDELLQITFPQGKYRFTFNTTLPSGKSITIQNKGTGYVYYTASGTGSHSAIVEITESAGQTIRINGPSSPNPSHVRLCNLAVEVYDPSICGAIANGICPVLTEGYEEGVTPQSWEGDFGISSVCDNRVQLVIKSHSIKSLRTEIGGKYIVKWIICNGKDGNVNLTAAGFDTTFYSDQYPTIFTYGFTATDTLTLLHFAPEKDIVVDSLVMTKVCPILAGMNTAYRYRYNGKESMGLLGGRYDYGARLYDGGIGRFLTVDPLTSTFPSNSPYLYAGNTPIRGIDEDGLKLRFAAGVSKEFKAHFALAITKLKQIKYDKIFADLEKSKNTYYLKEAKGNKGSTFSLTERAITWNPNFGTETTLSDFETGSKHIMSPVVGLVHEGAHALGFEKNPNLYHQNRLKTDERYQNQEEKRVITGPEQTVSRKLGEIKNDEFTRFDHQGTKVKTKSPISNEK